MTEGSPAKGRAVNANASTDSTPNPPAPPPRATPPPPAPAPPAPRLPSGDSVPQEPPGREATAAEPDQGPASPGLPALARILGSVVAPTTLVTALLYYFGWNWSWYFFGYFGVNSTAIGLGTVDYLIRSADALYIPVAVLAIVSLLALWGNSLLLPRIASRRHWRMHARIVWGIASSGCALATACVLLTYATRATPSVVTALPPIGFGAGVLIIAYAIHLRRVIAGTRRRGGAASTGKAPADTASGWARATEWAIVFALVAASLFAAATDYSAAVGQSRAQQVAAELPDQPTVVLYSKDSLSITQPGVTQRRCRDPQAAYRYRYDGLTLMLESSGKYVLVPRVWTRGGAAAILLPESDTTRLEFYPGTAPARAAC